MTLRLHRAALLLIAATLPAACRWSDFDALERGGEPTDTLDAQAALADAGAPPTEKEAGPRDAAFGTQPAALDGGSDGGDARTPAVPDADTDADTDAGGCREDGGPAALSAAGPFVELARIRQAGLTSRTIGPSSWLGSRRVWMFSRGFGGLGTGAPPNTPLGYPVAALEGLDRPWQRATVDPSLGWKLEQQLTSTGAATPVLTLRSDEPATDVGLAPHSLIRRGDDVPGGIAFVLKSVGWFETEVWLADLPDGATVAVRRETPLFRAPDPLFVYGAHRGATHVKLFACQRENVDGKDRGFCFVARVAREQVDQRSAYQVRTQRADGSWDWDSDLKRGTRVIEDVGRDLSVSWNAHLSKFLAVHSATARNAIILQTAEAVEGPWTKAAEVALPKPRVAANIEFAREHGSIPQRCGARIIVSYFEPTLLTDTEVGLLLGGEAVLGAIDLH